MNRTLYQEIASTAQARHNCLEMERKTGKTHEWTARHMATLTRLQDLLPSGSGIDNGTKIDCHATNGERIVLTLGFHHMNEHGMYDGWTQHTVKVTPMFSGISLHVTGHNRNGIKEYLHEELHGALLQTIGWEADNEAGTVPFSVEMRQACDAYKAKAV